MLNGFHEHVLRSSRYLLIGLTRNVIFAGRSPFPRAGHIFHLCCLFSVCVVFVQLQTITMKLVKDSFGDVYYNRALECVKVLRIESIKVSQFST